MIEPKEIVDRLEQSAELPGGDEERFAGYGAIGVPFASGDLLAMRRLPASSLGDGYTSVWHRDPQWRWTFYVDISPELACPRYFGNAISKVVVGEIRLTWSSPQDLNISIKEAPRLDWRLYMTPTPATRLLNAVGSVLPDALWRKEAVLKTIEQAASRVLRTGRLRLSGRVPNHQRFIANPMVMWEVRSSTARIENQDLGAIHPLPEQARLGDFWIPQRAIFATVRAFFEPLDPTQHALTTSISAG